MDCAVCTEPEFSHSSASVIHWSLFISTRLACRDDNAGGEKILIWTQIMFISEVP